MAAAGYGGTAAALDRPINIQLDLVNHGVNFGDALKKYTVGENPQLGIEHYKEGLQQFSPNFADWAVENIARLNTVYQAALADSTNTIFSVFPITFSPESIFKRKTIRFSRDFADISTMKTAPRIISSTVETIEGHMQFTAQAIKVDLYHLRTPGGREHFLRMLDAVSSNIWAYVALTAVEEFPSNVSFYRRPEQLFPGAAPPRTVEELLDLEATYFGLISREPQGLQKIINRCDAIMKQETNGCERILWTSTDMNYVTYKDGTNTRREFSGALGVANRDDLSGINPGDRLRYGDVEVLTIPLLANTLHNDYDDNLFRTPVATGGLWRFMATYDDVPPADFRRDMTDTYVCSWQTNDWDRYTVADALAHCVQFVPLDSDARGGSKPGHINRELLQNAAARLKGYVHSKTRTDFSSCPWMVDMLLKHNPHADTPAGAGEERFYPIHAIGELDERHTSTAYLRYIYEVMHARLTDGFSREERMAYTRGVALMKELSEEPEFPQLGTFTRFRARDSRNPSKFSDYYEPNQWGGPALERDAALRSYAGFGTVAGFLTVVNTQVPDDDRLQSQFRMMQDYLAVLEKLVRRMMTLTDGHAALSPSMLPRMHRHKNLSPIHSAMILASYFLGGPFTYPVLDRTSDEHVAQREPITQNSDAMATLQKISNNAVLKDGLKTLKDLREVALVGKDALVQAQGRVRLADDPSKKRPAARRQELKDAILADLNKQQTNITESVVAALAAQPELVDGISIVVDLFQAGDRSENETKTISGLRQLLRSGGDGAGEKSDGNTERVFTGGVMLQLHYSDAVLRENSTFRRAGIAVVSEETRNGPVSYVVDSERTDQSKGALFDEEHAHSFSGTLYTAGPLINSAIPPAPASGMHTGYSAMQSGAGTAAYFEVPHETRRTHARYASGYPVDEMVRGKIDSERRAVKDYEATIFRARSIETFQKMDEDAKTDLPDFFLHGLAYPYTGHPQTAGVSDFERRWVESHTYDALLGFAARVILMTSITLQAMFKLLHFDIPVPFFPMVLRPWQTQYMRSLIATTAAPCGTTYFEKEGMDRILSFEHDTKDLKVEISLAHKVMIEDSTSWYIAEYVKGDAVIGGCGKHYINEGVSIKDTQAWQRQVTDNLANGMRLQNRSNIAVLQSRATATAREPRFHLDVRGGWKRGDYAHRIHVAPESFQDMRTEPMYEGQVVTNEAYRFPDMVGSEIARLADKDLSFRQTSLLRQTNYTASQTTQMVYSHREKDHKKLIAAKTLWGEMFPGCTDKVQSNADIKIPDHFNGTSLQYFKQ